MSESRPSVTACILAHSSRGGLARLLGEIDGLVDEIVMGVDAGSRDDTLEIARSGADVVFRFEHVGPPVRARLLPLRHATGEWILSLDEDEGLDDRFGPLLGGWSPTRATATTGFPASGWWTSPRPPTCTRRPGSRTGSFVSSGTSPPGCGTTAGSTAATG